MNLSKIKFVPGACVACCLLVVVLGQLFLPGRAQANRDVRLSLTAADNNWNLPASLVDQLVRYPSAEVAFICGPQLKAGSRLNPFPWFDTTALEQGISHGEKAPRIAPIGRMNTDTPNKSWRNVIAGRVSIREGETIVKGIGTQFSRDVDASGPAPGYNGHLRIRDASGVARDVKVTSVESDNSLTLSRPWSYPSVNNTVADTFYHEPDFGTNSDHYFSSNYYDTALVQYINYYRTGDERFLSYARKTADALWHSGWIGDGTITTGDTHLPPRAMASAGLMLRALDGRPEMWDYLEREIRATYDNWVYRHKSDPGLYYDIRDDGYAQLYAVMLARVLPDRYPLYANGTLKPQTGTATNGAAKRVSYLSQTEDTAVNFFGRLQWADGSWRWNEEGNTPDEKLRDIEQPFMVGLYLESVVLLHQLSKNPVVKANLVKQLTLSVRHLYRDAFQRTDPVVDLPPNCWRSMYYFWGGGSLASPKKFNPPPPKTIAHRNRDEVAAARHLQSTLHHAFGYAYYVTGDESFKKMGDDVFEASFGDSVDGIHCLAGSGKAKDYDMSYRASGRYLVWRLATRQPGTQVSLAIDLPQRTIPSVSVSASKRKLSGQSNVPQPAASASGQLISNALLRARQLSIDLANNEQIEDLIKQIADAERAYKKEHDRSMVVTAVINELKAAEAHARTAFLMSESAAGSSEPARIRLGWAAARLKRADDLAGQR